MNNIIAYTDGAYSSSRDQGGIGIIILRNDKVILQFSKMYKHTTNNRMELGALIIVLRAIKNPIDSLTIYSDSMYCIGCAVQGWKRKKNKEMWKEFNKQYERVKKLCPDIRFIHIKGHQKGELLSDYARYNNIVDDLAVRASQRL